MIEREDAHRGRIERQATSRRECKVQRKGVILIRSQGRVRILAEQWQTFQNSVATCNILATYFSLQPLLEPAAPPTNFPSSNILSVCRSDPSPLSILRVNRRARLIVAIADLSACCPQSPQQMESPHIDRGCDAKTMCYNMVSFYHPGLSAASTRRGWPGHYIPGYYNGVEQESTQ